MRDPDLVTRAQRAAVALERAWERWRAMHGLSAEPMPPVSSYVGYSIGEPWGRPRVVFGVDAREAELLAALLDHHECVGPFYQDPAGLAFGPGQPGISGTPADEAWSRIPAQAQAAEEQERPEEPPQRWGRDAWPGPSDGAAGPGSAGGPDGEAGDAHGDQLHYRNGRPPAAEPARESGTPDLPRQDETRGSAGRAGDQRRGRRTELSRPSRRERRSAGRQRSAAAREPVTEAPRTDATEQAPEHHTGGPWGAAASRSLTSTAAEAAWPADVAGPSWADRDASALGIPTVSSGVADSTTVHSIPIAVDGTTMDGTTMDGVPVDSAAADDSIGGGATRDRATEGKPGADRTAAGDAALGDDAPAGRAPRSKSLYDVTKASRERARDAAHDRNAGRAANRGQARDQSRGAVAGAGHTEQPAWDPAGLNGLTDARHADTGHADAGHADTGHADTGHADAGLTDAGLTDAGHAEAGLAGLGLAGPGLGGPELGGPELGGPELGDAAGPDLAAGIAADNASQGDEGTDSLLDPGYPAPARPGIPGDAVAARWAPDADPGLGYADDPGLDYGPDDARGWADGDGWDDVPGQDELWDTGQSSAAGPGQDRDLDSGRSDAAGLDQLWDIGRGGAGGRDQDQARDSARATGSARAAGSALDTGSAQDAGVPPGGGSVQHAGPVPDARRDLPRDFGPDPLGAPGSQRTTDFVAAPPPGGSILTTAPRQDSRTARPSVNTGTETIAAELAGWAAGELPGQASARLAAWAAIGGVPAPGYPHTESSDVSAAGVGTERTR